MENTFKKEIQLSKNINLTISKGLIANRADSAIELRFGNNVILTTLICGNEQDTEPCFIPLHVDYQEKFYSCGKIPFGGKRELKLNDHEILISRLVDRSIRPCLDKSIKNDVQLSITVLSSDKEYKAENFACLSASLCIYLSKLGNRFIPSSEVILYLVDNKWELYPTNEIIKKSSSKLVIGGTNDSITMCEGDLDGLSRDKIIEGITLGFSEIKKHCDIQREIYKEYNNSIINDNSINVSNSNQSSLGNEYIQEFYNIFIKKTKNPNIRRAEMLEVENNIKKNINSNGIDIYSLKKKALLKTFNNNSCRIDGRLFSEIREIDCKIDYLPSVHGSVLFTRGYTQALVSVTLGDKNDEQIIDEAFNCGYNKIILHYNFPSFCVGELSYSKNVSRREIGHGNLALSSLKHLIPDNNFFTIRIVSDILSSDGSSSMATVCGSCLALNDAGIETKEIIAGIAMGALYDNDKNEFTILSDICAEEDELGDLDIKIIGTKDKLYGLQMDVKTLKLDVDTIERIIDQGLIGLDNIKNKMTTQCVFKRNIPKDFAPHSKKLELEKNEMQILTINNSINIQSLKKKHNCHISVNGNSLIIVGKNKLKLDECLEEIKLLLTIPEVGDIFNGIVKKVQQNYALVEFMNGKVGILKKEDVDWCKILDLTDILFVGDSISVKVIEIINNNKFILSHKVLIQNNFSEKKEDSNSSLDKNTNTLPDNI